jgi:uncharacterized protein
MYYKRTYKDKIVSLSRFYPVITLCGARQTGKTTLLKDAFPDYNYVSLDLPSTAAMAEHNPDEFFAAHKAPLIIDQVQYAPGLFRHLKRVIDQDRHAMGQYILTGSQKFNLMKEISDSLAGRAVILDLENLSLQEISRNREEDIYRELSSELMTRGQFPELWRVPEMPSASFYHSYLSTYLERDVRQILNVTSLRDFERFIRALAPRSGQLLNKTDIARDVGVSVKAINDWISVLQASSQIVLLEPWFHNISKRLVKSPKVYFCDSGLLCFLLGITPDNIGITPFKGQIWETLVFAELRKLNQAAEHPVQFWFYRDQQAREIDFILERGGFLSFAESKWTENPGKKEITNIISIDSELQKKELPYKAGKHYVICRTGKPFSMHEKVDAVGLGSISNIIRQ